MPIATWESFVDTLNQEPQNAGRSKDEMIALLFKQEHLPWTPAYVVDHPRRKNEHDLRFEIEDFEGIDLKGEFYISRNAALVYFLDSDDAILFGMKNI